ncbi:MAG: hypothetical protein ABI598_04120 [Chloroflexota bacterium]
MAERPTAAAAHRTHDLEQISALTSGDATARETELARDLIDSCTECAVLASDLRAVVLATRSLRASASMPANRVPRDFRLTGEDAARLRKPRSFGLGLLRQWRSVRPIQVFGGSLAALGLIGILISGSLPSILGGAAGGAASVAAERNQDAATSVPLAPGPGLTASSATPSDLNGPGQVKATGTPPTSDKDAPAAAPNSALPLGVASAFAFIAGVGILLVGRRRSGVPVVRRN